MAFPRTRKSFISFNGGELSPKMDARNDTEKYQSGCRQLQNFLPLPHGGAIRRRGFEFIAPAKYSTADRPSRVLRFQFSQADAIILEFGHLYIRFFTRANGQVMDPSNPSIPYEIASPYTAAEVFAIQVAQINDVVYISHPLHSPQKLTRFDLDVWTLETVGFDLPPFLDENVTTTTITPSAVTGTGISLVASDAVFDALNIGGYYQIGHTRDSSVIDTPITSTRTVALGSILGKWTVNTYGTWTAVIKIQTSPTNSGPWETVRTYTSKDDANVSDTGEQVDTAAFYQLVITWTSNSGTPAPRIVFGIADGIVYGLVKITAVADSTHATADVINDLYSTAATTYWSEGAWSDLRGYPTTVCFFQQRLWFAGSSYQPQTFWGSVTGSYEDFSLGSNADSGLAFTLSSTERSQILWMVGQKKLVLGTSGGIYAAYGDELEAAITATKPPLILLQSQYPMAYQRPVMVNSAILAIQSSGVKVREMVFDGSQGIYTANDLTVLADHIGLGGMLMPCSQMNRDSLLWAVTGYGVLVSLTYEKEQNVIAWARHTTAGLFESVDTIKGPIDDEVWVCVRRNINGTWKRFIERMSGYFNPSIDYNRVQVTTSCTSITHTVPVILTQPQSLIVNEGDEAIFYVTAVGATGYQWRKDGVTIGGAISSSYTIPTAEAADEANYSVVVTTAGAPLTSDDASLTVLVNASYEVTEFTEGGDVFYLVTAANTAGTDAMTTAGYSLLTVTMIQDGELHDFDIFISAVGAAPPVGVARGVSYLTVPGGIYTAGFAVELP